MSPSFLKGRAALFLSSALFSTAAYADPPTDFQLIDRNMINQLDGNLQFVKSDISIGDAGYDLPYSRNYSINWDHSGLTSQEDAQDNYTIMLTGSSGGTGGVSVVFSDRSAQFNCVSYACTPTRTDGSTLTRSGSTYTYTSSQGDKITFSAAVTLANALPRNQAFALATKITRADGYEVSIFWESKSFLFNQVTYKVARIVSVNSNTGYQLKFGYSSSTVANGNWRNFVRPITVTTINNAVDYCPVNATPCSGMSRTWPSISYGFGSNPGMFSVTDPTGRVSKYSYDSIGRLIGVIRPGHTAPDIVYGYTGSIGTQVASATVGGKTWSYTATFGATTTATVSDPLGGTTTIKSDTSHTLLSSITDPLSHITNYAYDTGKRLQKVTYSEGNYVELGYDTRGNATSVKQVAKPGSGLPNIVTSSTFSSSCADPRTCNKPLTTTDAKGNVTDYAYAAHGGLQTITSPAASAGGIRPQSRLTYATLNAWYKNSSGVLVASPTAVTKLQSASSCQTSSSCSNAADEVRSTIAYETGSATVPSNLLVSAMSKGSGNGALTATVVMTSDAIGNLVTEDGPLPGTADTTKRRYDDARRIVGIVGPDPDGGGSLKYPATRITYNTNGLPAAIERGTVNSQSDPDWTAFASLQQKAIGYDSSERKIQESLAAGGTTYSVGQYSYDDAGRPQCAAQRMNPATFSSLPGACSLTTMGSFGPDRITKTSFDAAGRHTVTTTALGVTGQQRDEVTKTYNNNNILVTFKDANNNLTTFEYDGFDRLSKTRYPNASGGGSSTSDYEQLTYDAASNVTQRRLRDASTISYSYDNLNRLSHKGGATVADRDYGYDLLGRLLSATFTTGGQSVAMTYDALDRKLTEASPQGTVAYQYDLASRRTRLTWPGGAFFITYDYLLTGKTTAIRENGGTALANYSYDNLGNRTGITRSNGATSTYVYDPASRLTSLAQNLAGTSADVTQSFTSYNPAGQIMGLTRSNDAYAWTQSINVNRNYTSNGLNQYTQSGSITPTYDARGNLTSAGSSNYGYNGDNLLTSAGGALSATLGYDPLDRLYLVSGSATTRFAYDGAALIGEYDSGNILLRRYVHGPGTDEPLVWYEGVGTTDRRWLHSDERGSITAISDGSGASIAINAYDEYGIPQSTNVGRFGYTGQTWLPEIGMYYYKARIYSPTLGRFLQTDPIGYEAGPNIYAYVENDPINNVDPTGLDGDTIIVCGGCNSPGRNFPTYVGPPISGRLVGVGNIWGNGDPVANQIIYANQRNINNQELPPQSVEVSVPTYEDENGNIVVTATKTIPVSQKYVLIGGRYYSNPYYVDPAPWLNLENYVSLEVTAAMIAVTPAVPALTARGTPWQRPGILNNNDYIRWGFNWSGSTHTGRSVFRLGIGKRWLHPLEW